MPPVDAPTLSDAGRAVAYLEEISPMMRGCAILSESGEVLGASGDSQRWGEAGRDLIAAADAAGGEPVAHAHVATGDGEAFCVRESGMAAVAVTERFTLASLMLFDMRIALRQLAAAGAGVTTKPHRLLLDRVSGYADEAAAYLRRRRHLRKPFARTYYADGRSSAWPADSEQGRALFLAASRLIEVAGPPGRPRSNK